MAVVRRYLIVANQTLQRAELRDELRKRTEVEPSSFYLLVPDTPAADYPGYVPRGGRDPAARHDLWATDYPRPGQR